MINEIKKHVYISVLASASFLLAGSLKLHAQTAGAKQLKQTIKTNNTDTARVNSLLKQSDQSTGIIKPSAHGADSAITYANAAQKLSVSLNFFKGVGNSYMARAKAYCIKKDSLSCNVNVRKAINIFIKEQLHREAAEAYLKAEEYYQAFGGKDFAVRIAWYEKALGEFKKTTAYSRQEATLKILGDFYQVQGDAVKAIQYLEAALKLINYVKPMDKAGLYDLLGTVYSTTGNLNQALKYGLLGVRTTEAIKDTTMQACAVYNRVGMTYYAMKQPDNARVYYEKALTIATMHDDTQTELTIYVNIAQTFITVGRYEQAVAMLKKVMKRYPAIEIKRNIGVDLRLLVCYINLKQFGNAKISAENLEAASTVTDPNSNFQLVIQSILAEYYAATVQDRPARYHIANVKKLAANKQNPMGLAIAYIEEAKLDSAQNNFAAAYSGYRIAGIIRDSIWNENRSKQIAQLQTQYDAEKKDQQLKQKTDRIKLLNNQANLQQANLKQEKLTQRLVAAGAILLAVLLVLSYTGYRTKQRVNKQLKRQGADIEEKNLALIELVQEKENLLKEKEWLMKEIHHRVKNNLQIVISLLSTQSNYLDNEVAYQAIRESQHRMQSISLIHQKLYQSDNLALVDINAYITDLVNYLSESFDTGTRIEFKMDIMTAEFDVTRAVPLGLILNEAITNAIKYAFPDGRKGIISISLKATDEHQFLLTIYDNGIGLPPATTTGKSKSLGMSLMRGLSKQLGGGMHIDSGDGTTIAINFINENLLQAI